LRIEIEEGAKPIVDHVNKMFARMSANRTQALVLVELHDGCMTTISQYVQPGRHRGELALCLFYLQRHVHKHFDSTDLPVFMEGRCPPPAQL